MLKCFIELKGTAESQSNSLWATSPLMLMTNTKFRQTVAL